MNHQKLLKTTDNILEKKLLDECFNSFINQLHNLAQEQPFLYAYLRDIIVALTDKDGDSNNVVFELLSTLSKRLKHFHHWDKKNNNTITLIHKGIIQTNEIKPHVRFSDADYEKFYANQNLEIGERIKNHKKTPFNRFKTHNELKFVKNYDHIIRKSHALNIIETYMAILENLDIKINRRWLDVGCGNGLIANAVNPKRHTNGQWDIHGCDLQNNKIQIAQNRACKNRHFYQENVLDKLQSNNITKNEFDMISMFEFCEHFADPFTLLKDISENNFKIMVIATPLSQKLNSINDATPDPVHLWSFSANAIIKMLEHLGLKIIYHSEIGVGRYTKGLDWLTVVAAKTNIYDLISLK